MVKRQLGDSDYGANDFRSDLFGRGLRWLSSVLAALSIGLLMWMIADDKPAEIQWPVHLRGLTGIIAAGVAGLSWLVLAIVNWIAWHRACG